MSGAYSADLAYIHHKGFSTWILQAAPHRLKLLHTGTKQRLYTAAKITGAIAGSRVPGPAVARYGQESFPEGLMEFSATK
jgi:hypothetical protein